MSGPHTDPPHTGVYLEVEPGGCSEFPGGFVHLPQLLDRGGGNGQVVCDEVGYLVHVDAAHDQYGAAHPGVPEKRPFLEESHRHPGRFQGFQMPGHRYQTVSVGVGLEHREHPGAPGGPLDGPIVGRDPAQVDLGEVDRREAGGASGASFEGIGERVPLRDASTGWAGRRCGRERSQKMEHEGQPRFFDSRAAYMMFVTTTTEKSAVAGASTARRCGCPRGRTPSAFSTPGMGDATVLVETMRSFHKLYTHVPWLVVGKEISLEDVRQALDKLPRPFPRTPRDGFRGDQHDPTGRCPTSVPDPESRLCSWRRTALEGSTTIDFARQIRSIREALAEDWQVKTSPKTGNPVYVRPGRPRDLPQRPRVHTPSCPARGKAPIRDRST